MNGKNENVKSLSKNSVFYLIYNVVNVIFPFITGIYVARILLPESIGEVAYAQNIAQYFVILSFLGLPTYGLREISKARKNKQNLNTLYSELFLINFISTFVFLSLYIALIFSVPRFYENIFLYLIVGISVAANFLNVSWLFEGLEEFKFVSVRNVIFKILSFVLLVILVKSPKDYLLYALVTVVGTVGNYVINVLYSGKFVKFVFKGLNLKRHLKSIFMLVAVNLAIEIYTMVDTTMIGIFCKNENVAFYTYGNKIYKIILQVITTFTVVVVPRLALYLKENRTDEFNGLLSKTLKVLLVVSVPAVIGIQFVSDFLIRNIYGDAYVNSAYVLRILSFILAVSPIGYLLGSRVLLIAGKEYKMIVAVGAGAIINIICNLILIPLYGEYGAAAASVVGEIAVTAIYVSFGRKYFRLKGVLPTALKVALSGAIITCYLFCCTLIPLPDFAVCITEIVGAAALYFVLLFLLKEESVSLTLAKLTKRIKKNGRTDS